MQDFEKLGVFYLGRLCDPETAAPKTDLLLYDSKDLVTHAVCVGMTGSGKTGLCLSILEEAAIDGIPAIAIDPKGDLGNLLLTFPELRPQDFRPWINEEDARNAGVSPEEYAAQQAEFWSKGLAEWGQDGQRIRRLRENVELAIYTPGSKIGTSLSVIRSLTAPPPELRSDAELLASRIATAASSLLGLLGIEADPLQSREHILLSNLLNLAWQQGKDLDLGAIIHEVQSPPLERIGVVDLESFFPAKERFAFAMQLNNLLASPGFSAWMEGQPLDVGSLLHTPSGKPRIAIISIAHLGDAERMFVVSLLLSEVLNWMRAQSGTTSLRAILYMDEIFGYFPPVANPPSKAPLLTLLKQARAFGLGVVLATQNPVDLDYKGLSNAGTWLIGRLPTERDKMRVLDGLEGALTGQGADFDRARIEKTLSALEKRKFLMNNVHDNGPAVFQVRWTLSYLRGPLTRTQIQELSAGQPASQPAPVGAAKPDETKTPAAREPSATVRQSSGERPLLPPDVPQYFVPMAGGQRAGEGILYRPALVGCATVRFTNSKAKIDLERELTWLVELPSAGTVADWDAAQPMPLRPRDLEAEPAETAGFAPLPPVAAKAKCYDAWKKSFVAAVSRRASVDLFYSPATNEYSRPDESEREFGIRIQQSLREQRDGLAAKLREKYASKFAALDERIRRAQEAVQREQQQARQSTVQTAISVGASLLGAFLGRKAISASTLGRATTAARGASRSIKQSGDVSRAQENVAALEQQRAELDAKFQAEVDNLDVAADAAKQPLETLVVRPNKTNISVELVALAWTPQGPNADRQ